MQFRISTPHENGRGMCAFQHTSCHLRMHFFVFFIFIDLHTFNELCSKQAIVITVGILNHINNKDHYHVLCLQADAALQQGYYSIGSIVILYITYLYTLYLLMDTM